MGLPSIANFKKVDLTEFSSTIPYIGEEEIERGNILKSIEDTFSERCKLILLEGAEVTGKTTLLAQFARRHQKNCISFFIGDDYWKSNLRFFYIELCTQMAQVCSEGLKRSISKLELDIEALDENKLSHLFSTLYHDLIKQAKHEKSTFYFVIDGLDKINNADGMDSILNYFPKGDANGIYILVSSLKGREYDFSYYQMMIQYLSIYEVEIILKKHLTIDEINEVYDACEGMPGYIGEILRQLKEKKYNKSDVLNNLPPSFKLLLEKTWKQCDIYDESFINFLSLITYSPEPLSREVITEVLNIEDYSITDYLEMMPFIIEKNSYLKLLSAYKRFFCEKLISSKTQSLQKIIEYYEKNLLEDNKAIVYLPELYKEKKDYSSIVNLLNVQNIYQTINSTRQISVVRKNLRILSSMSNIQKDWSKMSWSILTESIFTRIANSIPAVESQIKALLSLDRYNEALGLAYLCTLPEDRLLLLSHICKYMKKNDIEISNDILNSINDSITLIDNTVELTNGLIDKLIDICSNIFPVNADLSLKLIERITQKTGEIVEREKLMDYLLIRLLLRVDNENEEVEQIKEQIVNDDLQDFIKVTMDFIDNGNIQEVLENVKKINDTSGKLFYLQNWCRKNKKHEESPDVIDYALNIITESTKYSPTLRHLRQFAEPLIYSTNIVTSKELISKIETLRATIIKNPVEEYAKLELVLARTEMKWDRELAIERYYKTYVFLDEIQDYDGKCLVLIHLIKSYHEIIKNDEQLWKDLNDSLISEYNRLISSSADHFKITKKILSELTKENINLAMIFASKLNTQQRRYRAYAEIIFSHLTSDDVDFDFLEKVMNEIDEKLFKDWLLVQILGKLSKNKVNATQAIKNKYFGLIKNINSIKGKALGFAYYINWIKDEPLKCEQAFNELKVNIAKADEVNRSKELGYEIVQILSETNKEFAENLFQILTESINSNTFDKRITKLIKSIIELLIRMVPDILKAEDYKFKIRHIKNMILSIPSSHEQCVLLSNLALRCSISNDYSEILEETVNKCLNLIENCKEDCDVTNKIIVDIAPLLFEYEKTLFYEKLSLLTSIVLKDEAIRNIVQYIITKKPIDEQLDIKSFQQKITYPEALKICELIEKVEIDSNFYTMVYTLVNALVEPRSNHKYTSRLQEKQLLTITERLVKLIDNKLPDLNNIKHEGYKLASLGCLIKLRDTATHRAKDRWEMLFPSKELLKKRALEINNVSDKVFVLASIGKTAHHCDEIFGTTMIKEAESNLTHMTNPLDRVERYEFVAESYHSISNSISAKFILQEAINLAKACSQEQGRDQIMGGLIDLAHTIDPNLAQTYASTIDSNESLINLSERLTTLTLHSDPKKIHNYDKNQTDGVLFDFYGRVLKTLCSGRGTVHHNDVVGKYINFSEDQSFETIIRGITWLIENTISGNNTRDSKLGDLFMDIFHLLELVKNVETVMYESSASVQEVNFYKAIAETNIHTFGLNEQEEAKNLIINWINSNVEGTLKIHDPYFDHEMLELLKYINVDARITIYCATKSNELENLPSKYKSHWESICDHVPPETHMHIFATKSGRTPLHDRYLIGDKSGLSLGTSLNGYGSKITSIEYLDYDQKEKVEKDIILPLMMNLPAYFGENNERLFLKVFTLVDGV